MDENFEPLPGFEARFVRAGHILGAASVHLRCGERTVLFSGDLGRHDDLLMKPPAAPISPRTTSHRRVREVMGVVQ